MMLVYRQGNGIWIEKCKLVFAEPSLVSLVWSQDR